MLLLLALLQTAKAPEPTLGHPVLLPTEYVENRFAVVPETESGRKLRLFTDSAGGHFIKAGVASQLGLPVRTVSGGKEEVRSTPYPAFKASAFIPAATMNTPLFVFDDKIVEGPLGEFDGMLGQAWFAGRVWTFDYPGKRLYWRAPGDLPKHAPEHEVKLAFQTSPAGKRINNFARIEVTIDGEQLSFLLDTGATNALSDEALKEIGDGRPALRGTSFLAQGTYDRWHNKHADWRIVKSKTATGSVMIEVPKATIGGYTVGPVWFSVQSDYAFHNYMAQWMDKPTEGALGGSAFKYFRLTVDWPGAVAVFEKP